MPPRLAWFSHLAFADFRRGDAARPRTERPERDSPQPGDRTLPALPAVPAWLVLPADPLVLRLVARLRPDFYAIEEAAREAMRLHRMFNAIHLETGFKVDLVVKKIRSFSTEELRRREPGQLGRPKVDFATAEDTILSKLEWAKLGDSERQYGDAVGILQIQRADPASPARLGLPRALGRGARRFGGAPPRSRRRAVPRRSPSAVTRSPLTLAPAWRLLPKSGLRLLAARAHSPDDPLR
jgi:hypothetical protein